MVVLSLAALALAGPAPLEELPRGASPLPEVGVQVHAGWTTYSDEDRIQIVDKLAAAGVDWIRIDIPWCSLEPKERGEIDRWYVKDLDQAVDAARARNMRVLMTLWCTPAWATDTRGPDHVTQAALPERFSDYGRIAEWASRHWAGRVAAWQMWNEPDVSGFFAGSPKSYVALLRSGYRGIKAGDPSGQVVLGGPVPNDVEWLRAIYKLGAAPYFDILATHPYSIPLDRPPAMDDGTGAGIPAVAEVRALMKRFDDEDKPIWFTEFGWSTHENETTTSKWERGVSRAEQAEFLTQAVRYMACRRPYVEAAFIYTDRDRALPPDPDPWTRHVSQFGLLEYDLDPKPSYDALASLLTGAPVDLCAEL